MRFVARQVDEYLNKKEFFQEDYGALWQKQGLQVLLNHLPQKRV